ncbi:hypothetical protein Tco_0752825 [Tanacetum coccineum]|uniref:Uncharacterized protein n=1 Tax=Tanacetum coccineum TaxID=301880 RepID=A0ABQ4Z800_9ASTR
MVSAAKDPLTFDEQIATLIDFSRKFYWNNPEGDRHPFDLTKPLPLKEKAARYEIVGIEDMVPTLWSTTKVGYDKDTEKGIKYWGDKRQLWYRSQINKFSKHNVYSTQKILSVVSVKVKKLHEVLSSKRVKDLQLGVESYQKKLNITKPLKTFPGIEFKEFYTPSFYLPGAIYEDLNKQKRVIRADELYKFLDGESQVSS